MNQLQLSVVNSQNEICQFLKSTLMGNPAGGTGGLVHFDLTDKLTFGFFVKSKEKEKWIEPWVFIKYGKNFWEDSIACKLPSIDLSLKTTEKIVSIISHSVHQAMLNELCTSKRFVKSVSEDLSF